MVEKSTYLENAETSENRTMVILIIFSVMAHILFFVVDRVSFWKAPEPLYEEWEIEADLLPEFDMTAGKQDSSIPNSQKAEEAKVPESLLPQLPKKFAVDEAKQAEEVIAEEGATSKASKDEKAGKTENNTKSDPDEANRIAKQDAMRRLAIERLRQEQKFDETFKAKKDEALARLEKAASQKDVKLSNSGSLGLAGEKVYQAKLNSHIKRFYSLPDAYNLREADMVTKIAIRIDAKGNLQDAKIDTSSGDEVFDEMTFKAVKDSSPMPPPPAALAGQTIILRFSPRGG